MINFIKLGNEIKKEGYDGEFVQAKLGQDIVLFLLSKSVFRNNVTIKGGVVLQRVSKSSRRTTVDLDFDLVHYPLTDQALEKLIASLNGFEGLKIKICSKIICKMIYYVSCFICISISPWHWKTWRTITAWIEINSILLLFSKICLANI